MKEIKKVWTSWRKNIKNWKRWKIETFFSAVIFRLQSLTNDSSVLKGLRFAQCRKQEWQGRIVEAWCCSEGKVVSLVVKQQCFLVCPCLVNMTKKYRFLTCSSSQNIALKQPPKQCHLGLVIAWEIHNFITFVINSTCLYRKGWKLKRKFKD